MKVAILNTNDISGGAARAAYRLHTELCRMGHESRMFVSGKRSRDSSVVDFKPPMDLITRLRRRLYREMITRSFVQYRDSRPPGYELFTDDRNAYGTTLLSQLPICNVINLHWVSGFLDYHSFFSRVPSRTPIVWTLHDMNPFTGGCHYDHSCGRFMEGCGACPQLGSSDPDDLSRQVWLRKQAIFARVEPGHLHIVTPSSWLGREAKRSILLSKFPVTVIPNSLGTNDFAPRDRSFARDVLGVPNDANIILFAAESITNKRKGFSLLIKALDFLKNQKNLFLMMLGNGDPTFAIDIPNIKLGHISNDRFLSLIYSAADVYVIPSLQDNLPNTVLEALACGVPVASFEVGGIPDMVRPEVTGLLAAPENARALADVIITLLKNEGTRAEMSSNCRRIAKQEYSLEVQAKAYVDIYENLVG